MIKKLSACIREYKTASLLAPLFVTLEVVMETIIPMLMALLIDKQDDPRRVEVYSALQDLVLAGGR